MTKNTIIKKKVFYIGQAAVKGVSKDVVSLGKGEGAQRKPRWDGERDKVSTPIVTIVTRASRANS